jgi:hypothetical protein
MLQDLVLPGFLPGSLEKPSVGPVTAVGHILSLSTHSLDKLLIYEEKTLNNQEEVFLRGTIRVLNILLPMLSFLP